VLNRPDVRHARQCAHAIEDMFEIGYPVASALYFDVVWRRNVRTREQRIDDLAKTRSGVHAVFVRELLGADFEIGHVSPPWDWTRTELVGDDAGSAGGASNLAYERAVVMAHDVRAALR
jgi:hypothetical protein